MNIKIGFPPNMEKIKARFDVPVNAVFTYGDTLYNPLGFYVDTYLETHEETHVKQQNGKPEEWWERYTKDDKFRLFQEVEAYHNQYNHYCNNKKDFNKERWFLDNLAKDLSGKMYGNICTLEEAKKYIKEGKI